LSHTGSMHAIVLQLSRPACSITGTFALGMHMQHSHYMKIIKKSRSRKYKKTANPPKTAAMPG